LLAGKNFECYTFTIKTEEEQKMFSAKLKDLRKQAKMSQEKMAEK